MSHKIHVPKTILTSTLLGVWTLRTVFRPCGLCHQERINAAVKRASRGPLSCHLSCKEVTWRLTPGSGTFQPPNLWNTIFFFPFKLPALFVCYSITRRSKIHGQPILTVSLHSGATLCVAGRRLPVPWLAESLFYCQQSRFPVILGAYFFPNECEMFFG